MVRFDFEDDRTWSRLLILGVLLCVMVCFTSDVGLDTHVKMAVDDNGALPWGDLRPDTAGISDTEDGGSRTVLPLYGLPEIAIKGAALLTMLGTVACVHRMFGVRSAAVLSLSPALIFSIGRGYEEVYLALFCTFAMLLLSGSVPSMTRSMQALLGGVVFMMMPYSKGFVETPGFVSGTFLMAGGALLFGVAQRSQTGWSKWLNRPSVTGIFASGLVAVTMTAIGVFGLQSTLGIMADQPLRYISALLFAVIDLVFIFALFGMVLWPFILPAVRALRSIEHAGLAAMSAYVGAMVTALVFYVAALWTFEASLWNASWPWVVVTMGNNGRYITMLFIPAIIMLKLLSHHADVPTLDSPRSKAKVMGLTLMVLLPLSLLASLHGQTMWTDEAAEAMDLEQNEHFLFVSDDTLGMHWLYTFYQPLDAEANDITGHWRSADAPWEVHLNDSLSHVGTLVTSPDVTLTPNGWSVQSSGEVDLLNGGGEWRVLTRS